MWWQIHISFYILSFFTLYPSCDKKYWCWLLTECPDGFYGPKYQENCSANCNVSGRCDSMTGQCEGGCQAGWKQSKCDASKDVKMLNICKTSFFFAGIMGLKISRIQTYCFIFMTFVTVENYRLISRYARHNFRTGFPVYL